MHTNGWDDRIMQYNGYWLYSLYIKYGFLTVPNQILDGFCFIIKIGIHSPIEHIIIFFYVIFLRLVNLYGMYRNLLRTYHSQKNPRTYLPCCNSILDQLIIHIRMYIAVWDYLFEILFCVRAVSSTLIAAPIAWSAFIPIAGVFIIMLSTWCAASSEARDNNVLWKSASTSAIKIEARVAWVAVGLMLASALMAIVVWALQSNIGIVISSEYGWYNTKECCDGVVHSMINYDETL